MTAPADYPALSGQKNELRRPEERRRDKNRKKPKQQSELYRSTDRNHLSVWVVGCGGMDSDGGVDMLVYSSLDVFFY